MSEVDMSKPRAAIAPELYGVFIGTLGGVPRYWLIYKGEVVDKRMRRFKRAWWKTEAGAVDAARILNVELKCP